MGIIKTIIDFITGRRENKCKTCINVLCVSNHSPCYECKDFDQYDSIYNHKDTMKEIFGDKYNESEDKRE